MFYPLDPEHFIPPVEILAVEVKEGSPAARLCEKKNRCPNAHICLNAEREVLASLNAGCHEPIGVYARIEENKLILQAAGVVSGPSGDGVKHICITGLVRKMSFWRMIKRNQERIGTRMKKALFISSAQVLEILS